MYILIGFVGICVGIMLAGDPTNVGCGDIRLFSSRSEEHTSELQSQP